MRVAVALSGEMRGCQRCLDGLRNDIIKPFRDAGATVDLFVHTRLDKWCNTSYMLPYRSLQIEENRPRDESLIIGEYNPKHLGSRDGNDRRAFLYQSYLQQYWSLQAVGDLVQAAEERDGARYDWIVRTRPDCYLSEPIPVDKLDPTVVSVPWNDWWPFDVDGVRQETITDKFAIGISVHMQYYFDKISCLREYCDRFRLQGEHFTAWQLKRCNIAYTRHEGLKIVQMENPYTHSERP